MILQTAAFLTALGFVAWVGGIIFQYRGIAAIGAVIVVGVGVMTMSNGLEYRAGQTEEAISQNVTRVSWDYNTVPLPTQLPLGALVILGGGAMLLRGLNDGR